jgi:hypothetical protein
MGLSLGFTQTLFKTTHQPLYTNLGGSIFK